MLIAMYVHTCVCKCNGSCITTMPPSNGDFRHDLPKGTYICSVLHICMARHGQTCQNVNLANIVIVNQTKVDNYQTDESLKENSSKS
jgi:hypothetical protein